MLHEQTNAYPISVSLFDDSLIHHIESPKNKDTSIGNSFETYLECNSNSFSSMGSYKDNKIPTEHIYLSQAPSSLSNRELESAQTTKLLTNTRSRWTKEEEKTLIKLVSMTGARGWNQIASLLKTKTAKQCRDHYANCLNPEIKNSLWTDEEEQILLMKYHEYGSHWSKIKKFLPGRTTAMIKNYVTMLLKKNERKAASQQASNYHSQSEQNEDSSSCSSCIPGSDADEQSFTINMSGAQNNQIAFDYHDISSILI